MSKRILFIVSQGVDYLQDLTYSGLVELLGKAVIHDYPYHWQYHRRRKSLFRGPNIYPRNLGYVGGVDRHNSYISSAPKDEKELVLNSLKAGAFDIAILAGAKPDTLDHFEGLVEYLEIPWIFIDGGDWEAIGGDIEREGGKAYFERFQTVCQQKPPAAIFKREYGKKHELPNIFPLPFSINPWHATIIPPGQPKKFDVVFWGVESSEVRKKAFKLLANKYDCEGNGTVAGQKFSKYSLRGKKYFEALSRSKIPLNFSGAGFDTLRYWEIPAAGSLLLSEEPSITIPDNFEHGKTAIFFKQDLSDLLPTIDYYLTHHDEAEKIARQGQQHLLSHHTHTHRARYVLDILRGLNLFSAD